IVGLDGVRDAYRTGRGSFKIRATTRIESITSRRKGIVVTELPYQVGPEKVAEKLRDAVQSKRVQGITDYQDYTDRHHGLRLVLSVKSGYDPEAVLEQLYRYTPLEESFGINNVALVDGQPRTLGLKQLLEVFIAHRLDVVRRRSGGPHPAAGDLRPHPRPGRVHPRAAAAAADEVLPGRPGGRAGRAAPRDRAARGDPGLRGGAAAPGLRRARSGRRRARHLT